MKKTVTSILALMMILAIFTGCTPTPPASQTKTLNGTDISQFTVVYSQKSPDYCQRAAEYIRAQVLARTGVEISVCEAASGTYAHEIVVGETDRAISQALDAQTENVQFAILADDNHIALEGDYFIIAAAAYYFVETYVPGANFTSVIPKETSIHSPITKAPKNFIFLIGDGMGFNQTLLFDHMEIPDSVEYYDGESQFYGYYLPYQGSLHTGSLSGITDSAAGATALACGYKTINHYVGKDQDGNDLQSLTELAAEKGMATAVMSTDLMTGASPAGFSAHAMDRDDSDAILACIQEKMQNGTIISCGLHPDYTFQDEITTTLDKLSENEKGFFLMYEEGYIDKFAHNRNLEDTFAMVIRFNQAIGIFMEYAFYHPETFLIITADHETGALTIQDNEAMFLSDSHSGADVPLFGYGQGAEIFHNYTDENNQVPKIIAALWGVTDFGDPNA